MKLSKYDNRISEGDVVIFGDGAFWRIQKIYKNSPAGVDIIVKKILDNDGQIVNEPYTMRYDYSPSYLLDDDYAKERIQKNLDMLERFKNNLTQLGFTL